MNAALPGQNATPAMQDIMDRMHEVAFSFPDEITVIVEADHRTGWITATIL